MVETPAGSEPDSGSATVADQPPAHESQSMTQDCSTPPPEPDLFDEWPRTRKSKKKKRAPERAAERSRAKIDESIAVEADEVVPVESVTLNFDDSWD